MKLAHSAKRILGAGVIAVSLATLPMAVPAIAQTDTTSPTLDTTPFQETRDDNNNWGWLGLLGLIGLANLFRKPRTQHTVYREPETTVRTDYRE
ncbi:WGxxGxxG family protein [Pantanalinema rosaneae CENA516]|uniref:WGxxGxxG family protein n=1 Tax=Pantanalinema rosaneae TaxID=1620701 RepID=UPI003D6FAAB8